MPIDPMTLAMMGMAVGNAGMQIWGQNKAQKHDEDLANAQMAWNEKMWNKQNQYNMDFWHKQNAYNLDMWNLQNQYNSPIEQMARMKKAGLNPHLFYGQGSPGQAGLLQAPNTGHAGEVKGYSRASSRNILQGVDAFGDFMGMQATRAQADNAKAQADLARMKAITEGTNNALKLINVDKGKMENSVLSASLQEKIHQQFLTTDKLQAEIRNLGARSSNVEQSTQGIILDNKYKEGSLADRIKIETLKANGLSLDNSYKGRTLNARVSKASADLAYKLRSIRNLDTANEKMRLANTFQRFKNTLASGGITEADAPFIRAMYMDPDLRPYVNAAIYTDKGLSKVSDFLKFLNIRGSGTFKPKMQKYGPIKPNYNFFD